MAGKRVVVKMVDWTKLAATMPKAAISEFNAFRVRHEGIKGVLVTLPEKPTPINWDHYMQNVKDKSLVQRFKDEHSKLTVPYPADKESSKIAQEEQVLEKEVLELAKERKAKVADLMGQIDAIKAQKPFEEMTTDEYMDQHPKLKAEAEREIKEIGWSS